MERTELHRGRKLHLLIQLHGRDLRGQKLSEAFGQRELRLVDVAGAAEIELEGADDRLAAAQRHDDAGAKVLDGTRESNGLGRRKHPRLAVLERGMRRLGPDGAAAWIGNLLVARISQDVLAIGDGDGARAGGGQKQPADPLGRFYGHAVLQALERLGCDAQDGGRLLRADSVGVRAHIHENEQA